MDETTPMEGERRRVLAGRYTLRGLLGHGGMADVELAHDGVLDRQVAVKILHQRYAEDPQFLARFRREAQSAAGLSHPNIVAVYDTGEEDGRPFIVMEYIAGRSLAEILKSEGVLPHRAAEIGADAAGALHYAHERGLVHRDVKPGNIMVSEEGQVKVADFGIARAVNAETVTQTAMVFGTAAYIAPEQAQGEPVDRRTDVYALGCVLYELLTGRQPFSGESAVTLAYKHVSEAPAPPRQLNPEVAPELEAVVLKAMAKDPAARYQTCRELQADLQRALHGVAVAAPVGAAAYAATEAVSRTQVMPPPRHEEDYVYEEYEDERSPARALGWIVLALLILAAFVLVGFLLANLFTTEDPAIMVPVPDVRNRSLADAQTILEDQGFGFRLGEAVDHQEVPPNHVVTTDPEPGTQAEQGSVVTIIYSQGPPLATVPDVEGLPEDEAQARLREASFGIGERGVEPHEEIEPGHVIRSSPPEGSEIEAGSEVSLVVSSGPPTHPLPDVTDETEDAARATLENFCGQPPCVTVQTIREFHPTVAEGRVIRQEPGAGTEVQRGDTVTLVVSQGPELAPTPTPEPTPSPTPEPTPPEEELPPDEEDEE
jgi:eukaryotic-like serine/threonine-protein kinase